MQTITKKDLEGTVNRLNQLTGNPSEPYTKDGNGKFKANIGCYKIGGAYGKVNLEQICSDGGGVRTIFHYSSKRELYYLIHAYIDGLMARK